MLFHIGLKITKSCCSYFYVNCQHIICKFEAPWLIEPGGSMPQIGKFKWLIKDHFFLGIYYYI